MTARVFKWLLKGLLGLGFLVSLLVAGGLGYREWSQHEAEKILLIDAPNGIDEMMFVDLGGTQQWITIRGQNRSNPVILILHGGPGAPSRGFALSFVPWEQEFVVVQWDQPLAGRTFRAAGRQVDSSLTIESMTRDGNGLAEFLTGYLDTDKIILLGWSWGSILGVHMVKTRPDLYAAYVGTGQVVNIQEGESLAYANVLEKARDRNDTNALQELEQVGPPPYSSIQELSVQRKWAIMYESNQSAFSAILLPSIMGPRITLTDVYDVIAGMDAAGAHFFGRTLMGPVMQVDIRRLGLDFEVPIFIVQGMRDDFTPAALSRAYIEDISAPEKGFMPIESGGHFSLVSRNEEFLRIMKDALGPLAARDWNVRRRTSE